MPIGAQDPIVSHTGTGTVTVFAYDFAILAAADLKVKVAGVPVTTGFTVAGIGERDGGTVTFASPPAAAAEVLLYREITRDRATDYQYAGDLRDDVLDDDLDRVWMALQEDAELIERGVRVPLGESLEPLPDATARANTVLTFNAAGTPMPVDLAAFIPDPEASPENIWLPSSAAMTPVVQAATLADARTAMGVAKSGANSDITSLSALATVPPLFAASIAQAMASFGASLTVVGGTTAGTCSYRIRKGFSQLTGKTCAIEIYLDWELHTGTGALQIHSLPVTPGDDGSNLILFGTLYDGTNTKSVFAVRLGSGSNNNKLRILEVGAGVGVAINVPSVSTGVLRLSGVYLAA